MEIQVMGEMELVEHLREGGNVFSHCISVRNNEHYMGKLEAIVPESFTDTLNLEFYDLESLEYIPRHLQSKVTLPELYHIRKVIDFVQKAKEHKDFTGFTIHCWRGVSRSAGPPVKPHY